MQLILRKTSKILYICVIIIKPTNKNIMIRRTTFTTLVFILILGVIASCKKDNYSNQPVPDNPDTPVVFYQIPPINEYIPERLFYLFDSLNLLHYGDEPPTVMGDFMADSMSIFIVNTVSESQYSGLMSGVILPEPRYFEFKNQRIDTLSLIYKSPYVVNTPEAPFYLMERSDTDSTYFRVKSNVEHFINAPVTPTYFKSGRFTAEDFKHAYIIGNGEYFTIYYYEIRYNKTNMPVVNPLPMNAIIISGKMSTDSEGNIIIEDFWYGMETMVYYSQNVNLLFSPNPGDIIIMKSPNTIVQGSCDD